MIIKEKENISTFIGIDVGKYFVDIYCSLNNKYYPHVANDKASIKSLINDLKKIKGLNPLNTLVVIDLTGDYEVLCRDIFYDSGFTNIHLADGKKINYFKRSKKHSMAKTDKMDSYFLALYGKENIYSEGEKINLYSRNINGEDLTELQKLESRINDLKHFLVEEKNRFQSPNIPDIVKEDIGQSIKFLENKIAKLGEETTKIINNNDTLKRKYDVLIKQYGVGDITAKTLISFLPELGTLSRSKISSLSGTAPTAKDSGTIKGYRSTRGTGRQIIKKALFIITLSQIRKKDSHLNIFYKSLIKRGKKKMVAIVACMRKFVIYLNSILKKEMTIINSSEKGVEIRIMF
jgi:transposase